MHFFYGLGSTLTQSEAGRLIYSGYRYNKFYLLMSVLSLVLIIYITIIKIPLTSTKRTRGSKIIFKDWRIYIFILIIGFYSVAEHGTLNWFSSYLINGLKFNYLKSSQLLAVFFALLTLGRLLGGMLLEKLGKYNSILIFLCTASILYLLGVFIGDRGAIMISISGLFFSVVFPTLILIIGESFKDNYEYATGIIIGSATCFDIIFNPIIGILNDRIGYQYTFFIMPFSLLISALGIYILMTHKSSI
jgi:fucose permease